MADLLSEQSKASIASAFERAAKAGLIRAPEDVCDITAVELYKPGTTAGRTGENILVITISSFVFRLLTIFQVEENPVNRAYYAGDDQQPLYEAFAEVANLCCGAMNRELSALFPHLAMSIPYALSSQCAAFLEELKPQYLASFAITINDSVRMVVTLCMCCYAPVDIALNAVAVAQVGGELEMF